MLPYIDTSTYGRPERLKLLATGLDVGPLADALRAHPELWDQNTARTQDPESPHYGLSDIWARYAQDKVGAEAHISAWYPAADVLPVRGMARLLMAMFGGEQLGGVLITRIPPGAICRPHFDNAWHANNYEKFAVQVEAAPGQAFHFEGEHLVTQPGDIYWFDNSHTHWVVNESEVDRITAIFCMRVDRSAGAGQ